MSNVLVNVIIVLGTLTCLTTSLPLASDVIQVIPKKDEITPKADVKQAEDNATEAVQPIEEEITKTVVITPRIDAKNTEDDKITPVEPESDKNVEDKRKVAVLEDVEQKKEPEPKEDEKQNDDAKKSLVTNDTEQLKTENTVKEEAIAPEETSAVEEKLKSESLNPEIKTTYLINNSTNGTAKDVYVIRTFVYEVGILTDADNSSLNDTESHEEVDLTFFDPVHNGSLIDLSNIPVPIQTNISGISVTGIAPVNLGSILLPEGDELATLTPSFPLQVPLLPNALITVKHNISTTNAETETELLNSLPTLLGLSSPITGEPLRIETVTEPKTSSEEKTQVKDNKPAESNASSSKEVS